MSEQSPGQTDNLVYVRDMLKQLKVVSGTHEGSVLAYLIDMAAEEAAREIAAADRSKEQ